MIRDEFYERFPWIVQLPERPQCSECLQVQQYELTGSALVLIEHHLNGCSRTSTPVDGEGSHVCDHPA